MRTRVPMRERNHVIAESDVALSTPPRVGVRYSMDFAEDAHAKLGKEAIIYAVEQLSQTIVFENQHQIRKVVESFLRDREWAEPIIRDAIRDSVRELIREMMLGETEP